MSIALCLFVLPAAGLRAELLKNGDMGAGETSPAAWDKRWVGTGRLVTARDQTVFRSSPASLRLSAQETSAKGQVYQLVSVTPGDQLTAAGWIKCEGADTTAQFGLQFFTADYKPISIVQVRYVAGTVNWTPGKLTTTVPANAAQAGFILLLDGDGQAWLDDASLIKAAPAAGMTATTPVATVAPETAPTVIPDDGSTLIAALADFRVQNFSYGYEAWKNLATVTSLNANGLTLTGPADGGAGVVYGNPAPINGATHLRVRLSANAGHTAPLLYLKILGSTDVMINLPTSGLTSGAIVTKLLPLPAKTPLLVKQVQFQGSFNPAEKISLTLIDAAFVRVP
jgi:hypothetical protein